MPKIERGCFSIPSPDMAFIKTFFQALFRLYTLFVHFVLLLVRFCPFRTPAPELPIIAALPTEAGTPKQHLGAATQGVLFWTQVLRGPPSSRPPHNVLRKPSPTQCNHLQVVSPAQAPTPDSSIVIDICEPSVYDIKAEGSMTSDSSSDASFHSSNSAFSPSTPSPPPSPSVVIREVEECLGNQVSHDAESLGPMETFLLENPTAFNVEAKRLPELGDVFTLDYNNKELPINPRFADESISEETTYSDSRDTDLESNGSTSDMTTDAEELDWPLPPGPVFRFLDEKGTKMTTETSTGTTQQRPACPVALPLHISHHSAAPLTLSIPLTHSSVEDSPRCPSSPSPFGNLKAIDGTGDNVLNDRSKQLSHILASLPKEDLIALSRLPDGAIVTVGGDGNGRPGRSSDADDEIEDEDFVPEANSTRVDDVAFLSPSLDGISASESRSTESSIASDGERVSSPSVLPLQIVKRSSFTMFSSSTSLPYIAADSPLSSPSISISDPPSPCASITLSDEDSARHSKKSMEDLIALLDAEFDRKFEDDGVFNMFVNFDLYHGHGSSGSETEEEEHWSDVFSIESYAV